MNQLEDSRPEGQQRREDNGEAEGQEDDEMKNQRRQQIDRREGGNVWPLMNTD